MCEYMRANSSTGTQKQLQHLAQSCKAEKTNESPSRRVDFCLLQSQLIPEDKGGDNSAVLHTSMQSCCLNCLNYGRLPPQQEPCCILSALQQVRKAEVKQHLAEPMPIRCRQQAASHHHLSKCFRYSYQFGPAVSIPARGKLLGRAGACLSPAIAC